MAASPQVQSRDGVAVSGRFAAKYLLHYVLGGLVRFGCVVIVVVLALQLLTIDHAVCRAAERPSVEGLRRGHAELQRASRNVQGEVRVFRSEAVIPDAVDKEPGQLEIPLIREGNVWRGEERFRADFTIYEHHGDAVRQSEHSFAAEGGKVYEFTNADLEIGMLRICDSNTAESVAVMGSITTMFIEPIEALWNLSGTALVDMLQRPSTDIVPNTRIPGGYSLLASTDDGRKARYEFEPARNYPFGYVSASEEGAGVLVKLKRRVFSAEKEGMVFPTRIVHIVSLGPDAGYTEVTILDLQPLKANSPIASGITSESFRNFGAGYQVYNIRSTGKEELAERYERPIPVTPRSPNTLRAVFLWVNGLLILAITAYLSYRRWKRRQAE